MKKCLIKFIIEPAGLMFIGYAGAVLFLTFGSGEASFGIFFAACIMSFLFLPIITAFMAVLYAPFYLFFYHRVRKYLKTL